MPELRKMPFGPAPAGLDKRLPDWESSLIDLVNRNRPRPYDYGAFDRAFRQWPCSPSLAYSSCPGHRTAAGFLGAAKFLFRNGLGDVQELTIAATGIFPGDPEHSRCGDIVVHMSGVEHHLAVRIGDTALMPADPCLAVIDRHRWTASIGWDPNHG